jgi:hypothetical protein
MSLQKPRSRGKDITYGFEGECEDLFPSLNEYVQSAPATASNTRQDSFDQKEPTKLPSVILSRKTSSSSRIRRLSDSKPAAVASVPSSSFSKADKPEAASQQDSGSSIGNDEHEPILIIRDEQASTLTKFKLVDEEHSNEVTITLYELTTRLQNGKAFSADQLIESRSNLLSGILVMGQDTNDSLDTLEIPLQQLKNMAYLSKAYDLYTELCKESELMKLSDESLKSLSEMIKKFMVVKSYDHRLRLSIALRGLTLSR